jgi:predicted phosphodiesterase
MDRWLIIPDIHGSTYADERSLKAVENYMWEHKWAGILYLGDAVDLFGASIFYKKGNLADIDFIQSQLNWLYEMFKRHRLLVSKRTKMVYLFGNHEDRLNRYMKDHPELTGLLKMDKHIPFNDLGIETREYKSRPYNIGRAYFTHGLRYDQYHARWMALEAGKNIYCGHSHTIQEFSIKQSIQNHIYVGKSLGCLCVDDIDYMKGKAHNWQQAISTFMFRDGGFYNEYTSRIFDHRFVGPDEKEYKG